jgi:carboxymethylenebutenolidase
VIDAMSTRTVFTTGHDKTRIETYVARPEGNGPRGGVVVIHHMPGYDRATKEMTRRFAELGYDAACPNLYWREAPGASPDDAAAAARANGAIPDDRVVGDAAGVIAWLRALPTSNGKVGVIGYCSGARQGVLVACRVDVDAVVDCYGAVVTGTTAPGRPQRPNLVPLLPDLRAPLLGLFGNEDAHPTRADVDELEQILVANHKQHEIHRYDDAGHAFFATDRPTYRVAAANDGWAAVDAFFGRYLAT